MHNIIFIRFTPHALANQIRKFAKRDGDSLAGIYLDAASCVEADAIIRADRFFSKEVNALDDGLRWQASFVYLNPPSSQQEKIVAADFINKMFSEYELGSFSEGVMLVRASTDANWFRPIHGKDYVHIMYLKTLKFIASEDLKKELQQKASKDSQARVLLYVGKRCSFAEFKSFFCSFHNM